MSQLLFFIHLLFAITLDYRDIFVTPKTPSAPALGARNSHIFEAAGAGFGGTAAVEPPM
jgi:hypothetical protein